jgi:mannose-6-phosphate isomerase-like protein (cupin superfamily)
MEYRTAPSKPNVVAPDGSEITLLSTSLERGSMVLCTLQPGMVTRAVRHRSVEEMWHVKRGVGRLWRSLQGDESTADLAPGVSATIPLGASFQFRCDGDHPLEIVIATMPQWPGEHEAVPSDGPWKATV